MPGLPLLSRPVLNAFQVWPRGNAVMPIRHGRRMEVHPIHPRHLAHIGSTIDGIHREVNGVRSGSWRDSILVDPTASPSLAGHNWRLVSSSRTREVPRDSFVHSNGRDRMDPDFRADRFVSVETQSRARIIDLGMQTYSGEAAINYQVRMSSQDEPHRAFMEASKSSVHLRLTMTFSQLLNFLTDPILAFLVGGHFEGIYKNRTMALALADILQADPMADQFGLDHLVIFSSERRHSEKPLVRTPGGLVPVTSTLVAQTWIPDSGRFDFIPGIRVSTEVEGFSFDDHRLDTIATAGSRDVHGHLPCLRIKFLGEAWQIDFVALFDDEEPVQFPLLIGALWMSLDRFILEQNKPRALEENHPL